MARSKSKHRRVQMKIKQAWKKRAKRQKAAAKAETKPAPTPAEQRREQPRTRADSKVPVAPARGTSTVLIAALVLAILAAGGFALWKFVIAKKETAQTSAKPTPLSRTSRTRSSSSCPQRTSRSSSAPLVCFIPTSLS